MRFIQPNEVHNPIGREPRPKQAIPIELEKIITRATRAPPKPHEELGLGRSKGNNHWVGQITRAAQVSGSGARQRRRARGAPGRERIWTLCVS